MSRLTEALEILRATQLHPDTDYDAAMTAFRFLEARIAQLEKVADAARPVVDPSALSPTLVARMGALASALAELDETTTEKD